MKKAKLKFSADSIGIAAPAYGHEVPQMVKAFLKKAVFHTNGFYIILTYGDRHSGAAELAKKLCGACSIAADYINVILMADNWFPNFDMNEQKNIDKKVDEQIAVIRANVRAAFMRVCFSAESNSAYNSRKKFQCPLSQRAHFFEKIIDSIIPEK